MTEDTNTENQPQEGNLSKKIGGLALKMIKLANTGAKKLEDYANKSAEENQNENAKKLASFMNKISTNLDTKEAVYAEAVEKNADDLIKLGKTAFSSAKKVCSEMKTRAEIAKEKADKDTKVSEIESLPEETVIIDEPTAAAEENIIAQNQEETERSINM